MSNLQFLFFGGWQARHNDAELNLKGLKSRALLAYLAIESRQAHSRESLLGLLWPEMPQQRARNNLRVTLSGLRRSLYADKSQRPCLVAGRYEVQFDPLCQHWLDVAAFSAHWQAIQNHRHQDLETCQTCRQVMAQAVALYRGEFLAGFYVPGCSAFDEWLLVQRERLHIQVFDLLEKLTHAHLEAGEHKAAEVYARRQIELDPLQENAHRQLMRMLAHQGKRTAALSVYQSCHDVLLQELGVEPDAETLMLVQQIRAGALPVAHLPTANGAGTQFAQHLPERELTHNLPGNLTLFVGREEELAQLGQRFENGDYRLISIVGPGGIGKTRLAIEAARNNQHYFADGVYFVSLASRNHPDAVPAAIADAMKLTFAEGDNPPRRQLLDMLAGRRILLLLDNLEHLLAAGAPADEIQEGDVISLLLAILQNAPGVTILVTSRERLNIQPEDLFILRGLPAPRPDQLSHASQFAAVRLFCERAYRRHKGFRLTEKNVAAVARICELVDGMPLGIELATTWVRDLEPAALAAALEKDLTLLVTTERDVLPHHRSMEAVFAYSWRLLSAKERQILRRLSVFRAGFSREAAQQVAGATTVLLTQLRFKSLLSSTGADRYGIHPLLLQFAARKLAEAGEADGVVDRHSRYFLELLAEQTATLSGEHSQETVVHLLLDLENIRSAWLTALERGHLDDLETSLAAFVRFHRLSGFFVDGERMLSRALERTDAHSTIPGGDQGKLQRLRLHLLVERANMRVRLARLDEAIRDARDVIAQAQDLQDLVTATRGHILVGFGQSRGGDNAAARRALERAVGLARQVDHLELEGLALRYLGNVLRDGGEREEGERCLVQALEIHRRNGNRAEEQAVLLFLGVSRLEMGDYVAGQTYLAQSLQLIQATGNRPLEARIVNALGFVAAALGNFADAVEQHNRSRQISHDIDDPFQESHALHNLCTVYRKMGRLSQAEENGRLALELAQAFALPDPEYYAWLHLGYVWLEQGALELAAQAFHRSIDGWVTLNRTPLVMEATAGQAMTFLRQGRLVQAHRAVETVLSILRDNGLVGVDEPVEIYLTCYRVLDACDDARSQDVLGQAYDHLQGKASLIPDAARHAQFLEQVPVNRQVMACYLAEQAAHG